MEEERDSRGVRRLDIARLQFYRNFMVDIGDDRSTIYRTIRESPGAHGVQL